MLERLWFLWSHIQPRKMNEIICWLSLKRYFNAYWIYINIVKEIYLFKPFFSSSIYCFKTNVTLCEETIKQGARFCSKLQGKEKLWKLFRQFKLGKMEVFYGEILTFRNFEKSAEITLVCQLIFFSFRIKNNNFFSE